MIDAELYRVFYTVADCGNISAAAGRLFVSQPAVSKSVKKLEELTGCTLFARSSKGVRLTTEGAILYDYVRKGFAHLANGEQVLKKIRTRREGVVSVGISNTLCRYYFLRHLEEFHRNYPGIRITIVNRTSPETLRLVEKGAIDFGIVSLPRDRSGFDCRELLTIRDIFVDSGQYPELRLPTSLQTLSRYPLMMLEKDNVTRAHIDAHLLENGIVLQPEVELGSMDFLIEFAKIGLGIALVIRNFVEEELHSGLLREIPVKPAMAPRSVGIVTPKNLPLSVAAEAFIESLASAAGKKRAEQENRSIPFASPSF